MLQSLQVKNLALIESAEVEFTEGLNILSGETGAGKSILIGSINLALGEKVPKDILRAGAEQGYVELVFHEEDPEITEALKELDIYPEDGDIIISRRLTAAKSVAKINGETVPAGKIRQAAGLLIDIHGQHEHQSLLSKKKHLEILDRFAKNELGDLKETLAESYRTWRKLSEEYENADLNQEDRERELSFLNFEINEIEEASLSPGEDEELENEFRRISNGKKILEAVGAAHQATGAEGASELLGRAVRELMSVSSYDSGLEDLFAQASELDNLLNDLNREISNYESEADFNEERFYEVQSRLDLINHLKSKFGNSVEDILAACQAKRERLEKLEDYDAYLSGLKADRDRSEAELKSLCEKVSLVRREAAQKLTDQVKNALLDLNFLDVVFEMHFERTRDYTSNGWDDAEFLISLNPGESVKPLVGIASGGELSRIMLAIKTVLAEEDHIHTMIFDEIDAGISGRTAQKVSEKLKLLGKGHQVICITHLPQIASMADSHYLIEKQVKEGSTHTQISLLSEEDSVKELARMLGGVEITEAVLSNAREMKKMAQEKNV